MGLSLDRKIQTEREDLDGDEVGTGLSGSEGADLELDGATPLYRLPGTSAGEASVPEKVSFSRDLVNTYFREMGGGELLSREAEVALARRIEAAQNSVLEGLCQVPLLIGRIDQWMGELRQGRLRLADLVDISKSGDELLGAGIGQTMLSGEDALELRWRRR